MADVVRLVPGIEYVIGDSLEVLERDAEDVVRSKLAPESLEEACRGPK